MAQTPNRKIKELWAVIADNGEPIGEGIVAEYSLAVGGWTPFVTSERSNAEVLKSQTPKTGRRTVLRKFIQVGEDEIIHEGEGQ